MHRKINGRGVDNNSNYNSKKLETIYVHYYLYGNWWNKQAHGMSRGKYSSNTLKEFKIDFHNLRSISKN